MDPVSLISEVSTESGQAQFENRPDHVLSKLREYIKALGGELEVVARFGDKTLRLRGV
jgi:hypothetical protein